MFAEFLYLGQAIFKACKNIFYVIQNQKKSTENCTNCSTYKTQKDIILHVGINICIPDVFTHFSILLCPSQLINVTHSNFIQNIQNNTKNREYSERDCSSVGANKPPTIDVIKPVRNLFAIHMYYFSISTIFS